MVQAGRIVLNELDNKPAKEHFELLKDEWSQSVDKLTATLDGAADGAKVSIFLLVMSLLLSELI